MILADTRIYGPVLEILKLIAYAQMPATNANADVFNGARSLKFRLNLHLHVYAFLVYVSCEGCDKSANLILEIVIRTRISSAGLFHFVC